MANDQAYGNKDQLVKDFFKLLGKQYGDLTTEVAVPDPIRLGSNLKNLFCYFDNATPAVDDKSGIHPGKIAIKYDSNGDPEKIYVATSCSYNAGTQGNTTWTEIALTDAE